MLRFAPDSAETTPERKPRRLRLTVVKSFREIVAAKHRPRR